MTIATRARVTGVVYLLYFVTAVGGALIAPGTGPGGPATDAAANASNILSHETAYELGIALGVISTVLYVALTALFYVLLRPVNRTLALMMAFLNLVAMAVVASGSVLLLAPLAVLGGSSYLNVFDVKQLQAIALLFLNVSAESGRVALGFSAFFQLIWGYLIFRSTFLPRAIGVAIAVAGVGWLTYLLPAQPAYLVTATEVVGFAAEAALMLWLIVMGVNSQRWNALALAPARPA
jgi:hypothetical protein